MDGGKNPNNFSGEASILQNKYSIWRIFVQKKRNNRWQLFQSQQQHQGDVMYFCFNSQPTSGWESPSNGGHCHKENCSLAALQMENRAPYNGVWPPYETLSHNWFGEKNWFVLEESKFVMATFPQPPSHAPCPTQFKNYVHNQKHALGTIKQLWGTAAENEWIRKKLNVHFVNFFKDQEKRRDMFQIE